MPLEQSVATGRQRLPLNITFKTTTPHEHTHRLHCAEDHFASEG